MFLVRQLHQEMSDLQEAIQSTQDLQGVRRIDIRSHLGYDLVCCTISFGQNLVIRCCVCFYRVAPQKIG